MDFPQAMPISLWTSHPFTSRNSCPSQHCILVIKIAKNYGGPRIYLTNKLTLSGCWNFMNDGRRQESPGSKAKDFITHTNSHIQSITVSLCQFFTLQFPEGVIKRARRALHTQCSVLQGRNPESLVTGIQLDCLSFQKDILYLLYWSVSMSTLCFLLKIFSFLSVQYDIEQCPFLLNNGILYPHIPHLR